MEKGRTYDVCSTDYLWLDFHCQYHMTVYDQEQDTSELFSEGSPRRVKECLLSMQPSRALEIPLFSGEHIVLFKVD